MVSADNTMLQNTIDMLSELNEYELNAVQSVIKVIISKQDNYYKPLSEKELLSRIDSSLEQLDNGFVEDSEKMEDEITSEFDLWNPLR